MTMTAKVFPSADVDRIVGTNCLKDEYQRFRGEGLSREQLAELVQIGAADPGEAQNDSPTIGEMMDDETLKAARFIGYVIYPPRNDARVSVEGFRVAGVSADTALDLMTGYGNADEKEWSKRPDGLYDLRFWWD